MWVVGQGVGGKAGTQNLCQILALFPGSLYQSPGPGCIDLCYQNWWADLSTPIDSAPALLRVREKVFPFPCGSIAADPILRLILCRSAALLILAKDRIVLYM